MIVYLQYRPHLSGHPNIRNFVKRRLPFYILINGGYAAAMAICGILPSLSVTIYALVIIGIMVYYARFRIPKK